jgi:enoyl-[acyl-carrier protein] reductase III
VNVLITGGTKGIGLAIARRLARPGGHVFLNYAHDDDAADRAIAEIEATGVDAHGVRADCGTPQGAAMIVEAVREHTGVLDQVVHSAVQVLPAPVLEMDPHEFDRALAVNGTSLLYLVQAALPLLQRGSSICYLTSRGGRVVLPRYAAVGVAKAMAESLMRYLAVELAPLGVRINAVAPSGIDTAAFRTVYGDQADQLLADAAAANPSGRAVTDDDYTALVEFLASPAAAMIQGQVINVNGGRNLSA